MSDSEGDFSDELLELAGAGEKRRKRQAQHKSVKRKRHSYVYVSSAVYADMLIDYRSRASGSDSDSDPNDFELPLPDPFHDAIEENNWRHQPVDQPDPNPAPPPEPVPDELPADQPPIPPVVPRAPHHARHRHPPVGVNPPIERPRREGAGRNRRWQQDNAEAEGRDRPTQVYAPPEPQPEIPEPPPADPDEAEAAFINLFLNAAGYKPDVPRNRHEAMRSPKADLWRAAEKAEYDSLMENKTWILVPRPRDKPVVSCRWVYDEKHDGRLKARLVARGFTQVWGENYHETFSPVARC